VVGGAPTTTREGACAPQSAAVPSLGEDLGRQNQGYRIYFQNHNGLIRYGLKFFKYARK
jgi:putative component of toxin-antitoxin plasmid stabilization module